jgi:hypothetical protein
MYWRYDDMKRKTKRSKEAQQQYEAFKAEWMGRLCWLCEAEEITEIHHMARRRGDIYDDPRNLSALGWMCHRRYHDGEQRTVGGNVLRAWTDEDVERAKRRHDPDNYDPAYLDYLRNWERHYRETGRMEYQE